MASKAGGHPLLWHVRGLAPSLPVPHGAHCPPLSAPALRPCRHFRRSGPASPTATPPQSLFQSTLAPEVQTHKVNSGVDTWTPKGPQVPQCNRLKPNSDSYLPSRPCLSLSSPPEPPLPTPQTRRLENGPSFLFPKPHLKQVTKSW